MIPVSFTVVGQAARNWADRVYPWTNVYGLGRSLLATATACTLLFNPSIDLFYPLANCSWPVKISLFCMLSNHLEVARWLAVFMLLVVASGWRPRITGVLHWWLSIGFQATTVVSDGGDRAAAVLTLLLLPLTLTDRRTWHWQQISVKPLQNRRDWSHIWALSAMVMLRLQVSGIYFHSFIAKLSKPEWTDGTALYYWISHAVIAPPAWEMRVLKPLLLHGTTLALMTWGALLLELLLFMGLVMPKRVWRYFLILGIAFHVAIAIIFGILSFSLTMIGALILYLRPFEKPFALPFSRKEAKEPIQRVAEIPVAAYSRIEPDERVSHARLLP